MPSNNGDSLSDGFCEFNRMAWVLQNDLWILFEHNFLFEDLPINIFNKVWVFDAN
jgi:hypothetical protein